MSSLSLLEEITLAVLCRLSPLGIVIAIFVYSEVHDPTRLNLDCITLQMMHSVWAKPLTYRKIQGKVK